MSEGPGQGNLARYIWVWDVLSLSVASPALSDASESLGPGRAATGLVRVIRVTLSGSGLPRTFGPGRCTRVAGLGGESGGAGQSGGPNPGQSRVPCHRRIASASPARGYLPSLSARPGPRPPPGSVPALAALSPFVSSPCSGGLPPGPDHGAGPPTVRPGIPKRPTRGRYSTRWALASVGRPSPPAASDGLRPGVRRAACAGQRPADIGRGDWRGQLAAHRPAANTRCWLTVTGRWSNQPSVPRAGSRALSRAGRPCPGLAHRPPVAPAVSTRCQFRAGA